MSKKIIALTISTFLLLIFSSGCVSSRQEKIQEKIMTPQVYEKIEKMLYDTIGLPFEADPSTLFFAGDFFFNTPIYNKYKLEVFCTVEPYYSEYLTIDITDDKTVNWYTLQESCEKILGKPEFGYEILSNFYDEYKELKSINTLLSQVTIKERTYIPKSGEYEYPKFSIQTTNDNSLHKELVQKYYSGSMDEMSAEEIEEVLIKYSAPVEDLYYYDEFSNSFIPWDFNSKPLPDYEVYVPYEDSVINEAGDTSTPYKEKETQRKSQNRLVKYEDLFTLASNINTEQQFPDYMRLKIYTSEEYCVLFYQGEIFFVADSSTLKKETEPFIDEEIIYQLPNSERNSEN